MDRFVPEKFQLNGIDCSAAQTVERGPRMVTRSTDYSNPEKHFRERETSAQIKEAFEARRSSLSYSDMLVSLEYCISHSVLSYRVQSQRNKLPIAQYREEIIQTLDTSQVLVLSGETGWLVCLNNGVSFP